jgi:hypothetical protein
MGDETWTVDWLTLATWVAACGLGLLVYGALWTWGLDLFLCFVRV